MTVAQTILSQLGGRKFLAMTGAKNLMDHGDALSFRVKGKGVNYVKITLTPMDLYTVEYGYIRGTSYKVKAKSEEIYVDTLCEDFESNTGLYTSL